VPRSFFAIVYRVDNKAVLALEVPNNDTAGLDLGKRVTTVSEIERSGKMTIPLPAEAKTSKADLADCRMAAVRNLSLALRSVGRGATVQAKDGTGQARHRHR
jgi:hypothetical protein